MLDRRPILALAVVACLVLAGCGGSGGSGAATTVGSHDQAAETAHTAADGAQQYESGDAGGGDRADGGNDRPAAVQPALVRTGTVSIRVDDYDAARRNVASKARSMGGYVGESNENLHREGNRTWRTGYVVVRIPSDSFSGMLDAAKAEGTVVNEKTKTKDVSDQLVDLEARLENLRAKRDRLREFYDRANGTDELLQVENRLSSVQGKIERLKAEKRSLEDQVAYSTLRVELAEPEPEPSTPTPTTTTTATPYHERSVASAFADSATFLVVLARSTVVTFAYVAPFLLVAAFPVAGLAVLWWRRKTVLDLVDDLR